MKCQHSKLAGTLALAIGCTALTGCGSLCADGKTRYGGVKNDKEWIRQIGAHPAVLFPVIDLGASAIVDTATAPFAPRDEQLDEISKR